MTANYGKFVLKLRAKKLQDLVICTLEEGQHTSGQPAIAGQHHSHCSLRARSKKDGDGHGVKKTGPAWYRLNILADVASFTLIQEGRHFCLT